jgi:hypothetical protein
MANCQNAKKRTTNKEKNNPEGLCCAPPSGRAKQQKPLDFLYIQGVH